jgi:catechol 2,3-dioxygenase-like lactoylglutathione lyase family enzyme
MLLNIRHTGLVVRSLDLSLKFYEALGFELFSKQIEEGKFISHVVGIDDVKIETAKLNSPNKTKIELLQYHSHPQQKELVYSESNNLGCSHIALTVSNIEEASKKIRDLGGSIVNEPCLSPDGKVKVSYCHDLDGILIELVEEIKN